MKSHIRPLRNSKCSQQNYIVLTSRFIFKYQEEQTISSKGKRFRIHRAKMSSMSYKRTSTYLNVKQGDHPNMKLWKLPEDQVALKKEKMENPIINEKTFLWPCLSTKTLGWWRSCDSFSCQQRTDRISWS